MARPDRHAPGAEPAHADRRLRRQLLRSVVGTAVAVGALAGTGAAGDPDRTDDAAAQVAATVSLAPVTLTARHLAPTTPPPRAGSAAGSSAEALEERGARVSRTGGREPLDTGDRAGTETPDAADPAREAELSTGAAGAGVTVSKDLTRVDPRRVARRLMPQYGLSPAEFGCLDALWVSESDWDMNADNPTSTAYGIPQALMSAWDLPADYTTNPVTQVKWGLWYIEKTYGTACSAWSFKQAHDWY